MFSAITSSKNNYLQKNDMYNVAEISVICVFLMSSKKHKDANPWMSLLFFWCFIEEVSL